jgi:hypothetical protein
MSQPDLQETARWRNPLEDITGIEPTSESWEDWHSVWLELVSRGPAPVLTLLLGHLHRIFSVRGGYRPAILFLLELADGHRYGRNLEAESYQAYTYDRRQGYYNSESRNWKLEVAEKAWQLLCDYVFTNVNRPGHDGPYPSWAGWFMDREVLEKTLWFFDYNRQPNSAPSPKSRDRRDLVAAEFLRELVSIAWTFWAFDKFGPSDEDKKLQEFVFTHRPQLVEIMVDIHGLDFLLREEIIGVGGEPTWHIDENTLAHLENVATAHGTRTIEESILKGSYAAYIFLAIRTAMRESERQERIRAAEERAKEAARALEEARKSGTDKVFLGTGVCPDCDGPVHYEEGAMKCPVCGYTEPLVGS